MDFENLMFPNAQKKNIDLCKEYPELNILKDELNGLSNTDKLLQLILLSYDYNSPFVSKYTELSKRMVEVAIYVGFKHNKKGEFEKVVSDILTGKKRNFNNAIFEFCKMQGNILYTSIVSLTLAYHSTLADINSGNNVEMKDAKARADIFLKIKQMRDTLDSMSKEFLAGIKNLKLEESLYRKINNEIKEKEIKITPEQNAE